MKFKKNDIVKIYYTGYEYYYIIRIKKIHSHPVCSVRENMNFTGDILWTNSINYTQKRFWAYDKIWKLSMDEAMVELL